MFNDFTAIECCSCHMNFGVTNSFYNARQEDHKRFHCPSCGSGQSFTGQSEKEKLRLERDRLLQRLAEKDDGIKYQRERREEAERKVTAYKGVVTRTKNRIAGGACPCCNRTFINLHRHMANKHPAYAKIEELETATIN